jgi:hypothetical protein
MVVRLFGVMVTATSALAQPASLLDSEAITSPTSDERTGADVAVLDVTGILSMDRHFSATNTVVFLWVGPFNEVNGIGWDVVLMTLVPGSLRSDIRMLITNTALQPVPNFGFAPGSVDRTPGGPTQYIREMSKFSNTGLPNVQALADGLIRLEFFDTPDEAPGEPDGLWVSGTIMFQTVNPIPAPQGASVLLAVMSAKVSRRRRRDP